MLCFRKLPAAKNVMDEGGGGVSRLSVENCFVLGCQKFP